MEDLVSKSAEIVKREVENPDSYVRLIGSLNEAKIVINGEETLGLIDSGAQISTMTLEFAEKLKLDIGSLNTILNIEGTGGNRVPYYGVVEAKMKIPGISEFDEYCAFLVIPESPYSKRVPLQIGTLHIDEAIRLIKVEEAAVLDLSWKRARMASVICSKSAQLAEGEEKPFDLNEVKGPVKLTKKIVVPPFSTIQVSAISKVTTHRKAVNVMTDIPEDWDIEGVVALPTYSQMNNGSRRVEVTLKNITCNPITLREKTKVATISAANIVPPMIAPVCKGATAEGGEEQEGLEIVEEQEKLSPEERKTKLLEELDLSGADDWSEQHIQDAKDLMLEYECIFSLDSLELGKTSMVKHHIELTDYTPFKERYRNIPPHQFEEVKKHLKQMLEVGAIRKSKSPFASAVVLVRKKDGTLRFCIDLRRLNARTIKDAYSLPRIEESLDCLSGAQWFTSLDLKSGYWQVELTEEAKALTAFTVGPLGFYECDKMPFGLTNAPATFQRLMESCLGDLHLTQCIIYLDDIIIFSKTPEEHLTRLRKVFQKIKDAGLKLKPSKCEFFRTKIKYLGHVVTREGIESDPSKIEAIKNWPTPKEVTHVRSFLGFTNYLRKFIKNYAHIAKPLNKLISGDNASRRKAHVNWDDECDAAFTKLKEACCNAPVLAYANYKKPFKLHTDASGKGLGAILYQEDENGKDRVIAYASRTLNKAESNYPAHKLEFLALKWAVTERFKDYLYMGSFDVYTDNNPLTYILTSAKLDATGQRWVAALAIFKFNIYYKPGKNNLDADALSRIPWPEPVCTASAETSSLIVKAAVVRAILDAALVERVPLFEAYIGKAATVVTDSPERVTKMNNQDWRKAQREDQSIALMLDLIKQDKLKGYKAKPDEPLEFQLMLKKKSKFVTRNGLLYRKCQFKQDLHDCPTMQFCLPPKYREAALKGCHEDIGHLGIMKTTDLMRDRFYWPGMAEDIVEHIKSCKNCRLFKTLPEKAELHPIVVTHPLELVHMDYLTIEHPKDNSKDVNVLVVTDHFTRYAQAYITKTQTAEETAKVLWEKFLVHYGFPEKILTDQGRNFEGKLIKELCKIAQVKKLRTTPYHPEGNGQCERFNRTLISMLGTLDTRAQSRWPDLVSTLCHAYNCTRSNATGFSPYFLMYGRHPRLPIDQEFGVSTPDIFGSSTKSYAQKLKTRLAWAYEQANKINTKERKRAKENFKFNIRTSKLYPGDLVMVRQKAFKSKHKIKARWQNELYTVEHQPDPKIPIYRVKGETHGYETQIHRNLIFPIATRERIEDELKLMKDNENSDSETDYESAQEEEYRGPMTRSRTRRLNAKSLLKADQNSDLSLMASNLVNEVAHRVNASVTGWLQSNLAMRTSNRIHTMRQSVYDTLLEWMGLDC